MTESIPVGAHVLLRGSTDRWKVLSYLHDPVCKQYQIMSLNTGEIRRAFKHQLEEKSSSSYLEVAEHLSAQTISFEEQLNFNMDDLFTDMDSDVNAVQSADIPTSLIAGDAVRPKPDPGVRRFKAVSHDDVNQLANRRTEPETDKQTKWAMKVVKDWISETGQTTECFETLPPQELDFLLQRLFAGLQTQKGGNYSKSALIGLRAGINRHLTSPPFSRQINLMKDREFMKSNQVLCGIIKDLKRDGKDTSQHKEPISDGDISKLYESGLFSLNTPQTLQNKVFFDVMAHFGRRGREGLTALKKSSFKVLSDDKNCQYVAMSYNEADKTHHGVDSREKIKNPRMYATLDPNTCPLLSFQKYVSKLNPDLDRFFQKPLVKFTAEGFWYGKQPLGANTLNNFMSKLSAEAGLSRRYTNHCIRATVATNLCKAGVSNTGIMSVTGHRNVQSLTSYVRPSDEERREI